MRLNLNKQGGFTLIEVTIILVVLVILATIMLPQLGNFNRLARFVKAKEDLIAICASAKKMLDEVMLGAFYQDPGGGIVDDDDPGVPLHTLGPWAPIGLLVGPGAIPVDGAVENNTALHNIKSGQGWYETDIPSENCLSVYPDAGLADSVLFDCDYLENHLQRNDPFGDGAGTNYKNVFDDVGDQYHLGLHNAIVGGIFGWRGPYFDAITPDPWGNRYMVNSFALYAPPEGHVDEIFSSAVVCYSTGPDLGVDTVFNQPQNDGGGWVTGGDDLAVILSSFGPF